MTTREQILEAEVRALRAEIQRRDAPPAVPIDYTNDIADVIDIIRERAIHPTERLALASYLLGWTKAADAEIARLIVEYER
jgi:hypothetical protein